MGPVSGRFSGTAVLLLRLPEVDEAQDRGHHGPGAEGEPHVELRHRLGTSFRVAGHQSVVRLVEESGESLDALRARQPLGRLGTTEEVAEAVDYLVSAEFATGSVLVVDGGLTAA